MSEPSGAVFLSYSSQDTEPAGRIRDALGALGIEVWFDKNELRGGDAWDASIRKQIKECALFVPIISANTEARSEGYFRLEWKLAVDRSHLMADDQAFLLPVAIDNTREATARVPDRFRDLQWSRPFGSETLDAFGKRVLRLLSGRASPSPARAHPVAARPAGEAPSIAVLPFVNMSRDEENEYFADGLSDELLNVLAKIRGLRVASRTSAFFFKGKTSDIATIAEKLNVATILEGSVRKSGKRVRITAQLIEVATDSHLWSETYDRELDDIFAVQDDIAQSVVTELRAALLGERIGSSSSVKAQAEVRAAAATGRADNPEAYRLYLQGRFYVERMTQADVARAVELFEQAVALDPEFALGWTGLSRARWTQAGYGWIALTEGYTLAREAARRALAIAPDLGEAHACMGAVLVAFDWDWKGALAAFDKALALEPGNVQVLREHADQIGLFGRHEEALAELHKAATLDPLNATTQRHLGLRCVFYGHYDEAMTALQIALDLNPKAGLVNCFLAITRLFQGRPTEALEFAQREVLPDFRLLALTVAEHSLGHSRESDEALATLIEGYADYAAYQIAEACAWRGETERAFEWLERAYVQHDPGLGHSFTDPFFKALRVDRRWPPFMKKMGFV